jgi:hypothetical protein
VTTPGGAHDPPLRSRLVEAAQRGVEIDLREADGSQTPVDAEWIRDLLLARDRGIDPRGVRLRGGRITGRLDLRFVELPAAVAVFDAVFEEEPVFYGVRGPSIWLTGSSLPGLNLSYAAIRSDVWLEECEIAGPVDMAGITVGGQIRMEQCRIDCGDHPSLPFAPRVDNATVGNSVFLTGARLRGSARFNGVRFGPQLVLNEASIAADGDAADLHGVRGGSVHMSGLRTRGTVRLDFAELEGGVDADGASIDHGQVSLRRASVGGSVRLVNTSIVAPLLEHAVSGELCAVRGSVVLEGAELVGGAWLAGATIDGQLDFDAADVVCPARRRLVDGEQPGPASVALFLASAQVNSLIWRPHAVVGHVDLTSSTIGQLQDAPDGWFDQPGLTWDLESFQLGALVAEKENGWTQRSREQWLGASYTETASQFEAVAQAYENAGRHRDAIDTRVQGNYHLDRRRPGVTATERLARGARRAFLGWTISYGYRPLRVVVALLALWLTLWWWSASLHHRNEMVSTGERPLAVFSAPWFAADTVLPVIDLHQRGDFFPDQDSVEGEVFGNVLRAATMIGWAGGLLLVSGFTGLVRRV